MPPDSTVVFDDVRVLYRLTNATITPTISLGPVKGTFTGCVYDSKGHIVRASQRTKRNVWHTPTDPDMIQPHGQALPRVEGRSLYLGHYASQYGHFLLETLARLWVLQTDTAYDWIIFQPFDAVVHPIIPVSPKPHLFSPMKICCECFRIDPDRIILVGGMTQTAHLTVPTALFEINNRVEKPQALVYQQIGQYCEEAYHAQRIHIQRAMPLEQRTSSVRLYLSRRHSKKIRAPINEPEVEQVFSSLGFIVIYPEKMRFEDLVRLFKQAEVIAGFEGSAMHNSVFMQKGGMAITIDSGTRHPSDPLRTNQRLCDHLSEVRSERIGFYGTRAGQLQNIFDVPQLKWALKQLL